VERVGDKVRCLEATFFPVSGANMFVSNQKNKNKKIKKKQKPSPGTGFNGLAASANTMGGRSVVTRDALGRMLDQATPIFFSFLPFVLVFIESPTPFSQNKHIKYCTVLYDA